jgi:hypothetical protein
LVLKYERPPELNQNFHDLESATAKRDGNPLTTQFATSEVNLALASPVHRTSPLRRHPGHLLRIFEIN